MTSDINKWKNSQWQKVFIHQEGTTGTWKWQCSKSLLPWESQGPKHRPVQALTILNGSSVSLVGVVTALYGFLNPSAFLELKAFKCFMWATAACVAEANTLGRQRECGSSSQLTCSWGPAVGLVLWKELTVHTCCKRFGSDYLSSIRHCPVHRENKVVCVCGGGHITINIDGLNQMQKNETHMVYWHMVHRLESDQER